MVHDERVALSIVDSVAHLELTRPSAGNAIDASMVSAIDAAVSEIESDESVRALLISGRGRSFCVGGDLRYFSERLDTLQQEFGDMIGRWHRSTLPRLAGLPFPVVTAIQGGTAGGGLGLVWCADFVIAGSSTKVATGFVELGVSGDGGSSWHLPRLVGLRRAQEMLLDNRVLDAETALEWGLVNRVVEDADLLDSALETTKRLATRSMTAISHIKRLLLTSTESSYPSLLEGEFAAMQQCAVSKDVLSGFPAFVNRTIPKFEDRPSSNTSVLESSQR